MKKKRKKNPDEPCTSDGIKIVDYQVVDDLGWELYRAIDTNNNKKYSLILKEFFSYLNKLEKKYGKKPSITATRADRTKNLKQKLRLFLEAWEEAIEINDTYNMILIADSLVEYAIYDNEDKKFGKKWLKVMKQLIDKFGEQRDDDKEIYNYLKNKLNKINC